MNRFVVEGKILSKVECQNERKVRALNENKSIEEVPLTYGSVRIGILKIQLEGETYKIDRSSRDLSIKEEGLILEISYKYNVEGEIVPHHSIINDLEVGNDYELTMDRSYIRKNHYLKIINVNNNKVVKSYFFKSWANDIYFVDECKLGETNKFITPKEVLMKTNLDKELIIA